MGGGPDRDRPSRPFPLRWEPGSGGDQGGQALEGRVPAKAVEHPRRSFTGFSLPPVFSYS